MKSVEVKKKVYVLTLSRVFPITHPMYGINIGFEDAIGMGIKIHTIRGNYPLWESRIEQINSGFAVLSVRVWKDKPYRSKQIELMQFEKLGIQKALFREKYIYVNSVECNELHHKYETVAANDGLTKDDFMDWFKPIPTEPMAIIHFTDFRY